MLKSSSFISQPQKSTIRNALFRFHQTNTLHDIDLFKYSERLVLFQEKGKHCAVFNQDATCWQQLEDKYRRGRDTSRQNEQPAFNGLRGLYIRP